MLLSLLLPTRVVIATQVCGAQELVWTSGKVLLLGWQAEGFSAWFLFGFLFSVKVVVCGHSLLTLTLTINEHWNGSHCCPYQIKSMHESFWWWYWYSVALGIVSLFPHLLGFLSLSLWRQLCPHLFGDNSVPISLETTLFPSLWRQLCPHLFGDNSALNQINQPPSLRL